MLQESIGADQDQVREALDRLKGILAEDLDIHLTREAIGDTASLLEDGLALDSVVIIELIGQIEEKFDLQLGDEHLRPSLFENLTTLAELIVAEMQKAG